MKDRISWKQYHILMAVNFMTEDIDTFNQWSYNSKSLK